MLIGRTEELFWKLYVTTKFYKNCIYFVLWNTFILCLSTTIFKIWDADESKEIDVQYTGQSFVHSPIISEVLVNSKVWSNLGLIRSI